MAKQLLNYHQWPLGWSAYWRQGSGASVVDALGACGRRILPCWFTASGTITCTHVPLSLLFCLKAFSSQPRSVGEIKILEGKPKGGGSWRISVPIPFLPRAILKTPSRSESITFSSSIMHPSLIFLPFLTQYLCSLICFLKEDPEKQPAPKSECWMCL